MTQPETMYVYHAGEGGYLVGDRALMAANDGMLVYCRMTTSTNMGAFITAMLERAINLQMWAETGEE